MFCGQYDSLFINDALRHVSIKTAKYIGKFTDFFFLLKLKELAWVTSCLLWGEFNERLIADLKVVSWSPKSSDLLSLDYTKS